MTFGRILRIILLITVLPATAVQAQTTPQSSKFQQLCSEILESLQSFYPVHATEMGIHYYDNLLAEF